MRNQWWNNILQEKADGAAGGGTGGAANGTLLTGDGGGGAGEAPKGGGTDSKGDAANNGAAPKSGDNNGGAGGNKATDWRSSLPDDLREDPSLKVIHDIPSLVKSYLHAQKSIGADKLVIPGKHATADDWKGVYEKLGLPKDIKDYEVKMEEGLSVDKEFLGQFKKTAHDAGILPAQAQALATWFGNVNKNSEAEIAKQVQQRAVDNEASLKKEWGAAYKQELGKAMQVLTDVGDPALVKYMNDTGLGNDIHLIKLFNKMANKYMKEDAVVGTGGTNQKFTPKDAQTEANKILSDIKGPYYNTEHPGHKAAVAEVHALFEQAHPKKIS